jgi:predicted RNase H-like HicB family nuclease
MIYKFTAIITQEKKLYIAQCAELGVVSQGKTVEKAQENLKEAVELYLEDQPQLTRSLSKQAPLITSFELERV